MEQKLSLNFGFLGLGMGGTSIAAACADIKTNIKNNNYPYTALLINSNQIDLNKIEPANTTSEKMLIGDGKGAGRDILIGEQLYENDQEDIKQRVETRFKEVDYVWLVAGLGGGTGTGAVIQAIGTLLKSGFNGRFGMILTLPRLKEGRTVIENALQRLQKISQAMGKLGPILLVDNEKLFKQFSEEKPNSSVSEYLRFSNKYVAEALHDLNTVTASYLPTGEYHFDSSEFEKLLKTPGLLHFARFTEKASSIDSSNNLSYAQKLKELIQKGVLSDGYNLEEAQRLAVSVLTDNATAKRMFTFEFTKRMEDLVNELSPTALEKPIATYQSKDIKGPAEVSFYAVFAGLGLPQARISEMVTEHNRLKELEQKVLETEKKDLFASFDASPTPKKEEKTNDLEALFGSDTEKEKGKDDVEDTLELLKLL
ncbi:plasmid replication protein [Lysinibacillus sphaericus]|uniref:Plasmid replication protein n=2 Tax=Lysinibacillus sphaericus TaxID=1421 RepID=A0A6G9ZZG8_LYSSH|nr:plasmid replication protein [Lysinibacillus sphaericus]MBE5085760.1 plasmid replication protein [Bacillus thuringiensis]ACA42416.1 Plasmid replication protein [Lysinibacillus sphaericus C3-41]AMO35373.1 plasmid replication protein [Lysinibacillus sphaericus]AMR93024.1 plasmid replication protein [Lysinibacillus sphaericus]MBG9710630.1 plasmid replication protein [Lysinibacillus sphaericus]